MLVRRRIERDQDLSVPDTISCRIPCECIAAEMDGGLIAADADPVRQAPLKRIFEQRNAPEHRMRELAVR